MRNPARGTVYLVGAGPGDPELLTVKAARLLANADVVLYDSLVSMEILDLIPASAEKVDVGKRAGKKLLTQEEINSLLVDYASRQQTVVRLKGGEPLLFGRAGEEMDALRRAGVSFEIVPGITAAIGAAAGAKISLTDRRAATQVLFTTFSRGAEKNWINWAAISPDTAIAVYMPGTNYGQVADRLIENSLSPETPCVVVSHATRPEQQIRWSRLNQLKNEPQLPAPSILLVGHLAAQQAEHDFANWQTQFASKRSESTAGAESPDIRN
jgi:uroporphyrin-III C-methyltransferase